MNDVQTPIEGGAPEGAPLPAEGGAAHKAHAPLHHAHPHPKKHKARIEHRIPGRIRMKIPTAKGNPEILAAYQQAFSIIPGITKVTAKPETGSIVIHYDPAREHEFQAHFHQACDHHEVATGPRPGDEIEEMARKISAEAEFLAERSELAKTTVEFFKTVDHQLKIMTDNSIDLKIILAGGLAAYTFFEIGADAATPMWVTLALFSLNHFAELHNGHPGHPGHPGQPAAAPAAAR